VKPRFADQCLDKGRPGSSKEVVTLTACMTSHCASLHPQARTQPAPSGPLTQGRCGAVIVHVKGTDVRVHTFLGIPFAKPPLGPLRFVPPKPAAP
jgi:hypothetical protein